MTAPLHRRSSQPDRPRHRVARRRAAIAIPVLALMTLAGVYTDRAVSRADAAATASADARYAVAAAKPATPRPASAATPTTSARASTTITVPLTWVKTTETFTFGGVARSYLLVEPAHRGTKLPVLLELSGSAVTPAQEDARADFEALGVPAIMVFPAGIGESWDAVHCCTVAAASHVDDIGFLEAVVARVLTNPSADASRVYLAGYSNGGKMAYYLSCEDPAPWRAVAIYGAVPTQTCAAQPALDIQVSASSGDPELTLGPGGVPHTVDGYTERTVTQEVAALRAADGCPATGTARTTGTLTTTTYRCTDGHQVAVALYAGGDHSWPTGNPSTPSETAAMWRWFDAFGA